MPRYFLDITYKGTQYLGYQTQKEGRTVQSELEHALATFLREPIEIVGAGRTDRGVHAAQMLVHFDWHEALDAYRFPYAVNAILPHDISINKVFLARDPELHARFNAVSRTYTYRIARVKMPFETEFAWIFTKPLNLEVMQEAASAMMDYNSFESFCKSGGSNKTFFCDIRRSEFEVKGDLLLYHVTADRFLRGMVRAIVGTLMMVGKEKLDVEGFRKIIEAKDRTQAGSAAPAQGLFLTEVKYPEGSFEEIQWKKGPEA